MEQPQHSRGHTIGELQGKVHSIPEPLWCEEIKEVEKLLQVVLKRCSSQQQLVLQTIVVQDPEKLQNKKRTILKKSKERTMFSKKWSFLSGSFFITLDWLFFSRWASSTTRQAQSMEPRAAMSMVINSYEVNRT